MSKEKLQRYRAAVVNGRVHVNPVAVEPASWKPGLFVVDGRGGLVSGDDLHETVDGALARGREVLEQRAAQAREQLEKHEGQIRSFDAGEYRVTLWPANGKLVRR